MASLLSNLFPKALLFSAENKSQCRMSELENALISIMKIFHKYSGSTTGKLKKAQVKELVNNELSRFIEWSLIFNTFCLSFNGKKITDQETLDILMQDLDENGDLEIDFTEFATFVAMVTCTCHTFFTVQE
eukprot:gi/632983697/ref/XP_007908774.1/ PREDICTED: protein S100-B-like [Callorhinchus milii]